MKKQLSKQQKDEFNYIVVIMIAIALTLIRCLVTGGIVIISIYMSLAVLLIGDIILGISLLEYSGIAGLMIGLGFITIIAIVYIEAFKLTRPLSKNVWNWLDENYDLDISIRRKRK